MGDSFYSNNRIGKMQSVKKGISVHGSPDVKAPARSDSFYSSANYASAASVKTTGGVPGGKNKGGWFTNRQESGEIENRGNSLKKGSGHSYVTNSPIKNGA